MTRTSSDCSDGEESGASTALSTPIGEVLLSDYSVHKLPIIVYTNYLVNVVKSLH